jgi:hypothetical protein
MVRGGLERPQARRPEPNAAAHLLPSFGFGMVSAAGKLVHDWKEYLGRTTF